MNSRGLYYSKVCRDGDGDETVEVFTTAFTTARCVGMAMEMKRFSRGLYYSLYYSKVDRPRRVKRDGDGDETVRIVVVVGVAYVFTVVKL